MIVTGIKTIEESLWISCLTFFLFPLLSTWRLFKWISLKLTICSVLWMVFWNCLKFNRAMKPSKSKGDKNWPVLKSNASFPGNAYLASHKPRKKCCFFKAWLLIGRMCTSKHASHNFFPFKSRVLHGPTMLGFMDNCILLFFFFKLRPTFLPTGLSTLKA